MTAPPITKGAGRLGSGALKLECDDLTSSRGGASCNGGEPLHSMEAEQGVLGSMLISPRDTIPECIEKISEQHFFVPANRMMYNVLIELWSRAQAIDLITFTQVLRDRNILETVGGASYVTSLFTFVPTAANVGYYLEILHDKYILRQIIVTATESVRRAYQEPEDVGRLLCDTEQQFFKLRHGRNGTLPPIEDAADFIDTEIKLPPDIIDGILHRGSKMAIGGGSKSFKTWQFADLAVSVATDGDWLGRHTFRGRVLYINLELAKAFFQKRLQIISCARCADISPGFLYLWNLRGKATDLSQLIERILQKAGRDKYDLIILDPIYKVLGWRDENKAGDIAHLLNEIERLAVSSGAAVVFAAHFSKGNQSGKESIDRIGGSGVFARDPDSILIFTRHEEKNAFTVEATLRNHPPIEPFVVRWEFPLMRIDDELDPARLKKPAGRTKQFFADEVLDLLDKPLSAGEWKKLAAEELSLSHSSFHRLLREIKKSGSAVRSKRTGKWERKVT